MGNNLRTKEAIALGEEEGRSVLRHHRGRANVRLVHFRPVHHPRLRGGPFLDEETALLFASKKGKVIRQIDLIKKSRGEEKNKVSGLRLDTVSSSRYKPRFDFLPRSFFESSVIGRLVIFPDMNLTSNTIRNTRRASTSSSPAT